MQNPAGLCGQLLREKETIFSKKFLCFLWVEAEFQSWRRQDVGGRIITWISEHLSLVWVDWACLQSLEWGCLCSLSSCDWFLVLFASWAAADTCPGPALAVAWAPQLWVGHGPGNISRLVGPDQVRHSETSQPDISRAESRTCKNNSGVKILAFCDCRTGTAGVLRDCDDCGVMRGNKMIRWCLMTQYSYRSSSAQIVMRRKPIELNNTIKQ